jgi:hypothetical protein
MFLIYSETPILSFPGEQSFCTLNWEKFLWGLYKNKQKIAPLVTKTLARYDCLLEKVKNCKNRKNVSTHSWYITSWSNTTFHLPD